MLFRSIVVMSENDNVNEQMLKRIERKLVVGRYAEHNNKRNAAIKDQLATLEQEILRNAILQFKSTRRVAVHLGVSQPTIVRKMKRYGF